VTSKVAGSTLPSTSKSRKLSLSGVTSVSAIDVREAHQVGVVAGVFDHHEIVAVLDRVDRGREAAELRRFVLVDANALGALDRKMIRDFQLRAGAPRAGATVLDIAAMTTSAGCRDRSCLRRCPALSSATAMCIAVVDFPSRPFRCRARSRARKRGTPLVACTNINRALDAFA
jgi:hypothetical protein